MYSDTYSCSQSLDLGLNVVHIHMLRLQLYIPVLIAVARVWILGLIVEHIHMLR